jgi:hypothetical protein
MSVRNSAGVSESLFQASARSAHSSNGHQLAGKSTPSLSTPTPVTSKAAEQLSSVLNNAEVGSRAVCSCVCACLVCLYMCWFSASILSL